MNIPFRTTSLASPPRRSEACPLPPYAIRMVIQYALEEWALQPSKGPYHHPAALLAIATISKDWFVVADELVRAQMLATIKADPPIRARSILVKLRNRMILRRAFTTNVDVRVSSMWGLHLSLLAHAPKVENVEVVAPLDTATQVLEQFLLEGARLCPRVQRLLLGYPFQRVDDRAIHRALETWYTMGQRGGLRHFYIHDTLGRPQSPARIESIIDFCPNIQFLDRLLPMGDVGYVVLLRSRLEMNLALWRRFCHTCTQLTRFDWLDVPFATAYFEVFGAVEKPMLKRLSISAGSWSDTEMDRMLQAMPGLDSATVEIGGYGFSARNAHVILHSCPNLQDLRVAWTDNDACDARIFDDTFFETLVSSCPCLQVLQLGEIDEHDARYYTNLSTPLQGCISDYALSLLGTLDRLRDLKVHNMQVGGKGLVDLIRGGGRARTNRTALNIGVHLNEGEEPLDNPLYDTLHGVLERLVTCRGDAMSSRRSVVAEIGNADRCAVSGMTLVMIQTLLTQVRAMYPTCQFALVVSGDNGAHGDGAFAFHMTKGVTAVDEPITLLY